jgi:hypothetical protein
MRRAAIPRPSVDRACPLTKIVERVAGNAVYELRTPFSREIGRIIVHFAYFEQCVQEMVWQTLKLSEAAGRIAVREPRVTDRLEMLRDTIKLRSGTFDEELYKSIYKRANLLAAKRNMLAHGIWFYHKAMDEWHVQLTRGSWPKNEEELVAGSKKVTPESVVMTLEELRSATMEISELISYLKELRRSAVGPTPSPETHP